MLDVRRLLIQYPSSANGIALVMVLGILSVMVIMAVAFAISMRTERVAAGNHADSVRARQLVQAGLARALNDLAEKLGTNGLMSLASGTNYPPWVVTNSYTNSYTNTSTNVYLLQLLATNRANEATNFVPCALWVAATQADCTATAADTNAVHHWLPVDSLVYTNDGISQFLAESNRMGRVKYLILNCSGLLDANFVGGAALGRGTGTNPTEIAINNMPEFTSADAGNFLAKRNTDYRYETLDELAVLNNNFSQYPSNFMVYSCALPGYWDANTLAVSNQVNLAGDVNQLILRMSAISNAFVQAGFNAVQAMILFSNLLDYVDGDLVPTNYVYSVEPVPMISRILFDSVPNGPNYDVTVTFRLWYPFVYGGGNTFKFAASVKIGADTFIVPTTAVTVPNKSLSGLLSSAMITIPAGSHTLEIISATVKDNAEVNVVDMLRPNTTLPDITIDGSSVSWECIDPRFNYDPSDGTKWAQLGTMLDVDPVNGVTTNYWGNNSDADQDSGMYVTNGVLKSVGELGCLSYDPSLPWRTVKLYGNSCHRVLDCFAIGTNDTDTYVTNTIWHGRVNQNTRETEVLSVVFSNMPLDEYPGQSGALSIPVAEAQAFVDKIQARAFYTNLSDVGRKLNDADFPPAYNELQKEAIFRNTCGLLSTRQNLFTIIIEAQVASGGNIPRNPVKQRAVALVWRDPYTGEMFVRSIKWLKD